MMQVMKDNDATNSTHATPHAPGLSSTQLPLNDNIEQDSDEAHTHQPTLPQPDTKNGSAAMDITPLKTTNQDDTPAGRASY